MGRLHCIWPGNVLFLRHELVWLLLKLGVIVDCEYSEGNTPFEIILREAWLWATPLTVGLKKLLLKGWESSAGGHLNCIYL